MQLSTPSDDRHGVIAAICHDGAFATVIAKRGCCESLAQSVLARYAVELPRGAYRRQAQGVAFAGLGRETWLASCEHGGNDFAAALRGAIGALASISDQSDAYSLLRLSGPNVRDSLAKLIPIDLHSRAFAPGAVASTVASHIGVTLWRLDDVADETPAFDIVVARSLTADFWNAFTASALEFGLSVTGGAP
jgi:sarcosine oxidase subunit gamma